MPGAPLFGDTLVILGPPVIVKVPLLVTVPAEVVTEILPVVALAGTEALIRVVLATENVAPAPLNLTALTFENPVPLIVTAVPALPLVGEKLEIVSPFVPVPVTVKLMVLAPVPAGVVTETCPVVAPLGTVVWMLPVFTIVNEDTAVPLNRTTVAPPKK